MDCMYRYWENYAEQHDELRKTLQMFSDAFLHPPLVPCIHLYCPFRGYCVERLKYRCSCVCVSVVCHAIIRMMMSYLDERCSSRWKRTSNKKETKSFTLGASISWSFVLNSFVFSFRVITQLKRLSWQMIASSSRWWSYHLDDERWWAI